MIRSVPSWIKPGTYLENIRDIAAATNDGTFPGVTNVELLFFMLDDDTERIFMSEREEIASYRDRLSFTVHLPGDIEHGHDRLIEATIDFAESFILHPPKNDIPRFTRIVSSWRERYGDVFYLENTIMGPFRQTLTAIPDIPLCIDTGHALLMHDDPSDLFREFEHRVREIHFHGVANGKDHVPPSSRDAWLASFLRLLETFDGILEIELFSRSEIQTALDLLGGSP